jgi:hypothetical protein
MSVLTCKAKCSAWFPGNYTLEQGCRSACGTGARLESRCDYLDEYVGSDVALSLYGINCADEGGAFNRVTEMERNQRNTLIATVVIVIVLLLMYFLFR